MAVKTIITEPNKLLRQISKPVESVGKEEQQLMNDMLDTMYDANGIGLAAIQIGIPKRIIVMDIAKDEKKEENSINNDLYNLIYEIIIADHVITPDEIELSAELIEFYFQIPKNTNKEEFQKLIDNQHFNTDLSQYAMRLKSSLSYEQRMDIILICWQVLMVDENEDQLETSTVRTISTLLGLEDKDFILIRNRVKSSL